MSEASDKERINGVLRGQVEKGDKELNPEVCTFFYTRAQKMARKYVKDNPEIRPKMDDLVGDASLKAIEIITSIINKTVPCPTNPMHYITYSMSSAILATANDAVIHIPLKTRLRHHEAMARRQASGDALDNWEPLAVLPVTESLSDVPDEAFQSPNPEDVYDLWDAILGNCATDDDKTMVTLRKDGHTMQYVAKELGVTEKTISIRLSKIYAQVNELYLSA